MQQLRFVSRQPIEKGWSCDRKYCVTTEDGVRYLLRVTPEEKSANRADMFRMQKAAAALGIPMCEPVDFGRCRPGSTARTRKQWCRAFRRSGSMPWGGKRAPF